MMNSKEDMTLLAYVALQVEARHQGIIPQELIEALGKKIDMNKLGSSCLPGLEGESIEYVEEIEKLLEQNTDLEKLVAINRTEGLLQKRGISHGDIDETRKLIHQDTERFKGFLSPNEVGA
jgi:hypothetical protein